MSKDDDLASARETIRELTAFLEKMGEGPLSYGSVLDQNDQYVTLARGSEVVQLPKPPTPKLKVGDNVLISGAGLIKAVAPVLGIGSEATIQRLVGDAHAEIDEGGRGKLILRTRIKELKPGEKVLLDAGGHMALRVIPADLPPFSLEASTGVTWDDIGGQEQAKAELREAIELPRLHPEIFAAYGHKPIKGVLLSGPAGCGKTMLGKAAASAMAAEGPSGFIHVSGPEVLDPYVGVAEATVRSLFQRAKVHKQEHGSSAVIFIDEAEALLGNRRGRYSMMERTIVPTFLAQMDGVAESGALVILATNHPDSLDPAVVRDGRIDRKVRVSRPDKASATAIFALNLKGVPTQASSAADLSAMCAEYIWATKQEVLHVETTCGKRETLALPHTISGAMIAGICGRAKSMALRRDLAVGGKGKAKGITSEDLIAAIDATRAELQDLDHTDTIRDLVGGREVSKLYRAAA